MLISALGTGHTVRQPSSFFPFNHCLIHYFFRSHEAIEQASQPERRDIPARLPTVGTGFH